MNKYKTQDLLIKSKYTMITLELIDGMIVVHIYNNRFDDFEQWFIYDSFYLSQKQLKALGNRLSFLVANYVRKLCSPEAINDRIYEKD